MSNESQRDRSIDLLLSTSLEGALPAKTRECLEAETVAMWADGTLSAREAADVEAHLSTCARCQAVIATLARTAPQATVLSFWSRTAVRWAVPLGSAAAAAVLFAVFIREPEAPAAIQMAQRSEVAGGRGVSEVNQFGQQALAPRPAAPGAPAPSVPTAPREERSRPTPASERPVAVADESVTAKASEGQQPPLSEPVSVAPSSAPVPPPPSPPARSAPLGQAPTENARVAARPSGPSGALLALAPRAMPIVVVTTPDGQARWRIQPTGALERALPVARGAGRGGVAGRGPVVDAISQANRAETVAQDASAVRWEPARTDPQWLVSAGSAPSGDVAWFVGPGGLVLRTVDGVQFSRLQFPDTGDLVGIQAASADRAVVTLLDGRIFETSNAGTTWQRR